MKACIYGRAEFAIELSPEQIETIATCSAAHYDARCKMASEIGGFIYGWQNKARLYLAEEAATPTGDPLVVHATFRDLDLCTKILESAGSRYFGTDNDNRLRRMLARETADSFAKLMRAASKLTPKWFQYEEV